MAYKIKNQNSAHGKYSATCILQDKMLTLYCQHCQLFARPYWKFSDHHNSFLKMLKISNIHWLVDIDLIKEGASTWLFIVGQCCFYLLPPVELSVEEWIPPFIGPSQLGKITKYTTYNFSNLHAMDSLFVAEYVSMWFWFKSVAITVRVILTKAY